MFTVWMIYEHSVNILSNKIRENSQILQRVQFQKIQILMIIFFDDKNVT